MAKEINKLIDIEGGGKFIVREVMKLVVFIRHPHELIAGDIVSAFRRFMLVVPDGSLRMYSGASGDWFEATASQLDRIVSERLTGSGMTINGAISISGGQANIPDFFFEYQGLAIHDKLFKDDACFVQAWVPMAFYWEHQEEVKGLLAEWASILPLSYAYMSIALEGNQARKQKLAHRFLCVDIAEVSSVIFGIGDRTSGAHWINVFGKKVAGKLPPQSEIEAILGGDALVQKKNDNLWVQLSLLPILGDQNHQESISSYQALASMLDRQEVLYMPDKVTYFEDEDDQEDVDAQSIWHHRFLREG